MLAFINIVHTFFFHAYLSLVQNIPPRAFCSIPFIHFFIHISHLKYPSFPFLFIIHTFSSFFHILFIHFRFFCIFISHFHTLPSSIISIELSLAKYTSQYFFLYIPFMHSRHFTLLFLTHSCQTSYPCFLFINRSYSFVFVLFCCCHSFKIRMLPHACFSYRSYIFFLPQSLLQRIPP